MDEVKQEAAEASADLNTSAGVMATVSGAAAVIALGIAPSGPPALIAGGISAGFGLASGIAWWISGECAELALDPPRMDYLTVDTVALPKVRLPFYSSPTFWDDLTALMSALAQAISSVTTCAERMDGAAIAARTGTLSGSDARTIMRKQSMAMRKNADTAAKSARALVASAAHMERLMRAVLTASSLHSAGRRAIPTEPPELVVAGIRAFIDGGKSRVKAQTVLDSWRPQFAQHVVSASSLGEKGLDKWIKTLTKLAAHFEALAATSRPPQSLLTDR
jgi:hypothetical protein